MGIAQLNEQALASACRELAEIEPEFGWILERFGTPPLWAREATFATLVHIILEQQVSLASALAAFNKLKERINEVTPEYLLRMTDEELRSCYFSRQKAGYVRELAKSIAEGILDLEMVHELSDADAKNELKKVKGIGDWTADIFLLMAMRRPDVMPKGDLALHVAYRKLKNLEQAPNSEEFQVIAERWKPHRASAARLLWHFYLSERKATQ
ncbi:MAG: DNA-3-methyladenine glycosylase 2 family protein [Acidobacteria bacterium]|nr:DNA-3-methyladenine glycosylase 2 family protein [Acidobacteriota bacterium]